MRTLRQPDLIADLRDMNDWNATPAGVRDVVLKGHVIGAIMDRDQELLPKEILALTPTQHNVDRISDSCQQAIRAGRLIDFGRWTNPVIINGGVRGGPLYSRGVLGHPFRDPWMYMHSWEPFPGHTSTSVYLVNPLEPDTPAGDCESIELTPLRIGVNSVLMIGDRIYLHPNRDPETKNLSKYHCSSIPSTWRFLPGAERINNNLSPERAAAGNVLDPLMCALLILSTRGIVRERVEASEKLQKAREKNKQPRIPPYERVNSQLYITAIQARKAKSGDHPRANQGTHASPIPHLRMGHIRTYASGVTVLVRDALVNMDENTRNAWLMGNRSHYVVKQ